MPNVRFGSMTAGRGESLPHSLRSSDRTGVCWAGASANLQQAPIEPGEQRGVLETDFEGGRGFGTPPTVLPSHGGRADIAGCWP
jgi:hypothetical protein